MRKSLKYIIYCIMMFVLLFVLTGCSNQNSQNNQDTLKSKVKEEISYLDNNLISTL